MEPLALALRHAPAVIGIQLQALIEKLALYAGNLILFRNDPGPSLKEALHILSDFSEYFGLNYCTLNLVPLLQHMNLPLSLVGQSNHFKMKILPAFLYVLRHSPAWIPKKYFQLINSSLTSFLWGSW